MHDRRDRASLEVGRQVAAGLPTRPEWLALAKENLTRWSARNAHAPSLLGCYAEWEGILCKPLDSIIAVLTSDTDESRRLRQSSPFAGALSPQEVWEIKRGASGDATRA